jgi:hypothetical protein
MSVHFDEHHTYQSHRVLGRYETPRMTRWMVRRKIVRNEVRGYYILLCTSFVSFSLAGLIFWYTWYTYFSGPQAIVNPATGFPAKVYEN